MKFKPTGVVVSPDVPTPVIHPPDIEADRPPDLEVDIFEPPRKTTDTDDSWGEDHCENTHFVF